MMAAYALVSSRKFGTSSVPGGKNIGVLLVSPDGKIIGCGVNTNRDNGTFHAEVNCLQSYYKYNEERLRRIPGRIPALLHFGTVQMCSGMIWEAAADTTKFLVYYGMVDPAQLAGGTKLSLQSRNAC